MEKKWAWLAGRIKECGFNSNAAFATAIGWVPTRVSEMVNGIEVNNGKFRNFPQDKIVAAANALKIPVKELLAYNNDITTTINFDEPATTIQIDPDLMTDIIDAITEFLAENNLTMSPEQRKDLIKHFCNKGLTDRQRIKDTLSAMQALSSELFTKRNTK